MVQIEEKEEKLDDMKNTSDVLAVTTETSSSVFPNVPTESTSSTLNDALEIFQHGLSSDSSVNRHSDDWITRAETTGIDIDSCSIANLLNEAIEDIRNDDFLPDLGSYIAPENSPSDSVALNPIDLEQWPEFDFSIFDSPPNGENETNH